MPNPHIEKIEFRWNSFTWHLFTPHAPSTTVAHSEGRSSTNVTNLDLYTNLRYLLENVHTAPNDHKNLGAAFADTRKLWRTLGVWWRRYEKKRYQKKILGAWKQKVRKGKKYEQTIREGRVNSMMPERSQMLMTRNIEDCKPPPLNCGSSSTLLSIS